MDTVHVKAILEERVSAPIAQQMCEDFLEWLDEQGFAVERSPAYVRSIDERDFKELALDFIVARMEAQHA